MSTACRIAVLGLLSSIVAWSASAEQKAPDSDTRVFEWNFEVFLDDAKVGYHNFKVEQNDDRRRLVSEANLKVKLLFLTLYRYQHENVETWKGECLQRIESRTNVNGKNFAVVGTQGPEAFEVQASGLENVVPGCVKTFAYWNPDFLEEPELMNPQTGEILPVELQALAEETLMVGGKDIDARRYRLRAKDMDLELWYSQDDEWLGLQSTTKDGHTIRYELTTS